MTTIHSLRRGAYALAIFTWVTLGPGCHQEPLAVAVPVTVAGSISGDFSADSRGAATYSLHLPAPPGTGGIEPDLTLFYNSSAGNGLLGVGWNLAGMSAIARTAPTMAIDGFRGPLSYTNSDRLNLDGAPLIPVQGGYWSAGTIYHTEKESLVQVRAETDNSFTAQTTDGKIIRYGATVDSRIIAPASANPVRIWAASSVSDRFGNTMKFTYSNNQNQAGQYFPIAIDYTTNDAHKIPFTRRVEFSYDFIRPDAPTYYAGGSPIRINARLVKIQTFVNTPNPQLVATVSLDYDNSPTTGRTCLTSVTHADSQGNSLPPTTFKWQTGSGTIRSPQQIGLTNFGSTDNVVYGWHDFNGDGLLDLTAHNKGAPNHVWVTLQEPDNTLSTSAIDLNSNPCGDSSSSEAADCLQWADFDGDGRSDLLCSPNNANQNSWVRLSTGTSLDPPINLGVLQSIGGDLKWVDFNGDGRVDLIGDSPEGRYARLSNGKGLDSPSIALGTFAQRGAATSWQDFNGDGMADLLVDQTEAPFFHWALISTGKSLKSPVEFGALGAAKTAVSWIDINGDGMADLVGDEQQPPFRHWVRFSTGTTLTSTPLLIGQYPAQAPPAGAAPMCVWRDINGDGYADLISSNDPSSGNGWFALLFNGTRLGNATQLTTFVRSESQFNWLDLNGDGMIDLAVTPSAPSGQVFALLHQGPFPDLLTLVENGIGGQTAISYAPITGTGLYSTDPQFNFLYPIREEVGPIYVVSQKRSNDGRLNPASYQFNYSYRGSTLDLSGRGWLGFGEIIATDTQANVIATTTYGREFPMTGVVMGTSTTTGTKEPLDSKSYQYLTRTPYPGVVQILRSSETLTFYDGDASYSTGCEYAYDPFGSPALSRHLGDLSDPADDYVVAATFLNQTDTGAWLIGYPLEQTIAKSCQPNSDNTAFAFSGIMAKTRYSYSPQPPLVMTSTSSWDDNGDVWLTTAFEYDFFGNPTRVTSPASGVRTTAFEANFFTFETGQTNVLGQSTQTDYDPRFGVLISHVDENGIRRQQALDGFGQVVAISAPDPNSGAPRDVIQIRRVLTGNLSAGGELYVETRTLNDWNATAGNATAWRWKREYKDGMGRTILERQGTDADPNVTIDRSYEYDNEARLKTTSLPYFTSAPPPLIRMSYDEMGRVIQTNYPNGSTTNITRDIVPNPSRQGGMINRMTSVSASGTPDARTIVRFRDPAGNDVKTVYGDNAETSFQYDVLGRVTDIVLPNQSRGQVTYDTLGRHKQIDSTESGTTRYAYDEKGRILRQVNGSGASLTYAYDALGRVASVVSPGRQIKYSYDEPGHGYSIGRLTTAEVSEGNHAIMTSLSYDAYGHISRAAVTIDGLSYAKECTYDPSGRLISSAFDDGSVQTTGYLPIGFVGSLSYNRKGEAPSELVTYGDYTPFGKPQAIKYANGFSISQNYRADGWIVKQEAASPQGVLFSHVYEWTPLNQISRVLDSVTGKDYWSYAYGPQGYLMSAKGPLPSIQFKLSYDAAGNISDFNDLHLSYTGQRFDAGSSAGGAIKASYTGDGRLALLATAAASTAYQYNAEGRLVSVKDGSTGKSAQFAYEHSGARVFKADPDGVVSIYPFSDCDVTTTAEGQRLGTRYIKGPFGVCVAITTALEGKPSPKPVVSVDPGTLGPGRNGWGIPEPGICYFLRSPDGSTSVVGDEKGSTVTVLNYDPFGGVQTLLSRGKDISRSKYIGKEFDYSTGLYCLESRYLDPRFGRFISPDARSLGGADTSAAAFNRYAYGGNDPINNQDPTGQFFGIDDLIEAIVILAVGTEAAAEAATTVEAVTTTIEVTAGTYVGGAAVNGSLNPGKWHWGSPKTYAGLFTGAFFGAFGGDIADGISASLNGGYTGGLLGAATESGVENAVFQTESDPNPQHIAEAFFLGAAQGAVMHSFGEAVSSLRSQRFEGAMEPRDTEMSDLSKAHGSANESGASRAPSGDEGGNCSMSLGGGTLVLTENGPAPIEQIRLGDKVMAQGDGDVPMLFMVTGTGQRIASKSVTLVLGQTSVVSSQNHPFFVLGKGWTEAGRINAGDKLRTLSGTHLLVDKVAVSEERVSVFSIEVEGAGHFSATALDLLAHNFQILAQCLGHANRVERLQVQVDPADIGTGSATTQTTRNFARAMGLPNDDAGHVIARMLGGSGSNINNIFPQAPSINRGIFARWERYIRFDISGTGQSAIIDVHLNYATPISTRPVSIQYEYTLGGRHDSRNFGN